MPAEERAQPILEPLRTGVPGLDTILGGGFLRGGLFIIQGAPGAGKTILGNQICFHHVAEGGRALYVTLLAENHARMMLPQRPHCASGSRDAAGRAPPKGHSPPAHETR
jgi:predicted ATP-dependent serine protease